MGAGVVVDSLCVGPALLRNGMALVLLLFLLTGSEGLLS